MAGLAAAGSAFGPVGGVLGALGDAFMGGGAGSSAAPQTATAAVYGSGQDGSNWNVNFSGLQTATSTSDKSGSGGGYVATPGGLGGAVGSVPVYVWALALGVVGLMVWKRSKSGK